MATATAPKQNGNALSVSQHVATMGDRRAPLAKRIESVRGILEANKDSIFQALPRHITPDRLMRVVLTSIRKNPKLMECSPESLFGAITEAASLGLETDGVLGHAYLIPYGAECVLVPGYKGLIDLARRSSNISTLKTNVVRKGDYFEWEEGDSPILKHRPSDDADREDQPVTHVYMVAVLRDGGIQRNCWPVARIERHKEKFSQAWKRAERGKKDSPWHTDWDAMARKTVVREAIARGELPVSVELQRLASREEQFEAAIYQEHHSAPLVTGSIDDFTRQIEGMTDDSSVVEPDESQDSTELSEADRQEIEIDMETAIKACSSPADIAKFRKSFSKLPELCERMAEQRLQEIS